MQNLNHQSQQHYQIVAIATKSITFDTEGEKLPKQTLVGDVTPPTKVPETVLSPKSIALPKPCNVIY